MLMILSERGQYLNLSMAVCIPRLLVKITDQPALDIGVVQTAQTGFNYNGESNLDFQYGMALVTGAQPVTLYQVGDTVEGGVLILVSLVKEADELD